MTKMWKRISSLIISFSCIIAMCYPASAAESSSNMYEQDGYLYYNHSTEHPLSDDEADAYSCFEVSRQDYDRAALVDDISMKDYILSLSKASDEYYISNTDVISYESEALKEALYECDRIVEITLVDDILYITYFTSSGVEVYLGYNDAGLCEKVVYYPDTDTAIVQNSGSTVRHDGFRAGYSSEISDTLLDEIDKNIEENDWESLASMDCIIWEPDVAGEKDDSMFQSVRGGGAMGFTSDDEMLANLKTDFTIKNDSVMYNQSKYTPILKKNYQVKVLEDRNGYVRKKSEWRSFAASVAVTSIGAYLSVKTAGTIAILDAIGIAMEVVDGVKRIQEDVTLYRTAKYRYLGARDGYVLDDTVHNTYVHVIYHSAYGEFTGGYTSSGIFTWVDSDPSSAYDHTAESIADHALKNYANNIFAEGYCSMYWPDA